MAEPKFKFDTKQGDLFTCPENWSLAHCISADIQLGKGIAVLFRDKYGGLDDLEKQGAQPGGLAFLVRGHRFIYNLVTKEKYFHKPTYQSLESSLEAMKQHCVSNHVTHLAMPLIGCGLDGLEWSKVEPLICKVFANTDVQVTVYKK